MVYKRSKQNIRIRGNNRNIKLPPTRVADAQLHFEPHKNPNSDYGRYQKLEKNKISY